MPPTRTVRSRTVTNENDENGAVRLTRTKSLAGKEDGPVKQALQSKKGLAPAGQRRRAALGDLSNVAKNENVDAKNTKKAAVGRAALVSKASQVSGISKTTRSAATRPVLAATDKNAKAAELKRRASGSGVLGGATKKRTSNSLSSNKSGKEDVNETTLDHKIDSRVAAYEDPFVKSDAVEAVEVSQPAEDQPLDLDKDDFDDPLMVSDYVRDIFSYFSELEIKTMPNPDYMDNQNDLEWSMRAILVDWLVEVHSRFHLLPETLFLTINIIDRFLSVKVVQLDRLQLVGIAAMFIAAKYEEVMSPHVDAFRHVANEGFTKAEILSAERYVLAALDYDLSYPNPMNFLRRISKADNYDIETRTFGKYYMELSLLDRRFMCHPTSIIAAASMYLARRVLHKGEWDATLAAYSGYTEDEILPVFELMIDYLARPVSEEAFFRKYASKKFLKASLVTREWAKSYAEMNNMDVSQPVHEVSA